MIHDLPRCGPTPVILRDNMRSGWLGGRYPDARLGAGRPLVGCAPLSDRGSLDIGGLQSWLARFRRAAAQQRARNRKLAPNASAVLTLLPPAEHRPAFAADHRIVA